MIESMGEIVALCGEEVSIEVKVGGHPQPDVRWTSDDRDVITDKAMRLDKDGEKHRLIITRPEIKHEGRYQITAINNVGVDTQEVNLIVRGMSKFIELFVD